ncbi:MAG TPA: hypothetical protein VGH20_21555 [Myxococcales bacterium]
MKKLIGVAAVLALAACGGGASQQPTESSQVQHATGPEWVTRGSGAFKSEKGRSFYGVGIASGIRNAAMRRATADARARSEIGTQLDGFVSHLNSAGGAARSSSDGDQLKTYLLAEATIVDHWVDNDGSEWALAQLEMDKLKSDLDKAHDLDAQSKQAVKMNGDRAFDELNAEGGTRPR